MENKKGVLQNDLYFAILPCLFINPLLVKAFKLFYVSGNVIFTF
jgi:hypothetical protein